MKFFFLLILLSSCASRDKQITEARLKDTLRKLYMEGKIDDAVTPKFLQEKIK